VESITELLCEYSDLFPTTFTEMKGIARELDEMKIPLRAEARPIRQGPYRLNPIYKKKVKAKINRMLEAGIIEPVEESEWISLMVVQEKKQDRIRICIDLRKLNDACLHDSFPTPFTDKVLENVGGQELYSFTNGFSGYHQIKIAPKDRYKTTFAIEWGSYQYTVMPFGLKNAPAIFSRVFIVAFKEFIHQFLEVYLDDWTVYSLLKKPYRGLVADVRKMQTMSDIVKHQEVHLRNTFWDNIGPYSMQARVTSRFCQDRSNR
jgi:hypothetical protein